MITQLDRLKSNAVEMVCQFGVTVQEMGKRLRANPSYSEALQYSDLVLQYTKMVADASKIHPKAT